MRALALRLTAEPGREEVVMLDLPGSVEGPVLIEALVDEIGDDLDFITIKHPDGWVQVVVDDFGLVKNLGTNRLATMLVYEPLATQQGYRIAGPAVLLGLDQYEGETLDLPAWVLKWVLAQDPPKG